MLIEAMKEPKQHERKIQEISCKNCSIKILKNAYCSHKCNNTYTARVRRQTLSKEVYVEKCLRCNLQILKPKRRFYKCPIR